MDTFELNKVAGALLGTLLFTMALGLFSNAIFDHGPPEKPGYDLPSAEEAPAAATTPAAASQPLPDLLAKADPQKGQGYTKPCQTCHSFEKGGAAKIGPPLYGVVGRQVASIPGFAYSDALKAKGGNWTFEELNKFIENPRGDVSGTKMSFAGEKDPQHRADILAWLRTQSDNPAPLPAPSAASASGPTAAESGNGETAAPPSNAPPSNPPNKPTDPAANPNPPGAGH